VTRCPRCDHQATAEVPDELMGRFHYWCRNCGLHGPECATGEQARVAFIDRHHSAWVVSCKHCWATPEPGKQIKCECGWQTPEMETVGAAIAAWNKVMR